MTDYTTPSGAGQLMVRDQGYTVEFWVYAGYNLSWNNLRFSVDANGGTTQFRINYHATRVWMQVGSINVGSDQTITYRLLDATGTTSIGGPTSMSVSLNRGRQPDPPQQPRIDAITQNSFLVNFADNYDGGVGIDYRQILWSTNPNGGGPSQAVGVGQAWIGGLAQGTRYYVWAQSHNGKGWSNLSVRSEFVTWDVPEATTPVRFHDLTQTSIGYQFVGNGQGGTGVVEWQIAYGQDPNTPTNFLSSPGDSIITGLQPATTYYVWSRGRNAVGWGPYSSRSEIRTIAGASVCVNNVWRDAVPYVKVAGVWQVARPWVKVAGVWKESQ
jgi:hypothetical protein